MHRNYYTFAAQVIYLNKVLDQGRILACFTHRKNELVIEIESDDVYLLRIGIDPHKPYILLYNQQNIKDPRIDFFQSVISENISSITIKPFDKYIQIQTATFMIGAQFYSKSANIYLFDNDGNVINSFKKREISRDNFRQTEKLIIDTKFDGAFRELCAQNPEMPLIDFIVKFTAGFNKLLAQEYCYRSGSDGMQQIYKTTPAEWQILIKKLKSIRSEIKTGQSRIYKLPDSSPIFTPVTLHHLENLSAVQEFDTVNQGWINFIQRQDKNQEFEKQVSDVHSVLKKRIAYLQRTLKKIADAEMLEKRKQEAELKGHLLQTFAREISKGTEKVVLKNIFSSAREEIEIKLNPRKSIYENAQKYFEKFKNIEEQKEQLSIKKDTYQHELELWEPLLSRAKNASTIKDIEKIQRILIEKNILQDKRIRQKDRENLGYSFNRLLLGKKWEIFIGKNAANNDLLTFKFARKYDIWLHAQGVSGSHVIIHKPDKTHNPPARIIEQAAGIAAFNSGAQHSSTVPVNYTEVRHVRKPRKASPGTVTITNEKTIFVKPVKIF